MIFPELPRAPGIYALILCLPEPAILTIGALGPWPLPAGWYAYVGSAHGPGGLAARAGRHLRGGMRRHWHIDYLRAAAEVEAVWWQTGLAASECAWARRIGAAPGAAVVVPRFGASDCRCPAHLWRLPRRPRRPAWVPAGAQISTPAAGTSAAR